MIIQTGIISGSIMRMKGVSREISNRKANGIFTTRLQ